MIQNPFANDEDMQEHTNKVQYYKHNNPKLIQSNPKFIQGMPRVTTQHANQKIPQWMDATHDSPGSQRSKDGWLE